MRDEAVAYARAGLRVIGLFAVDPETGCFCGKATCKSPGKHPLFKLSPHGSREPFTPPERVAKWPEPYNLGIQLGPYGSRNIYVFDVDMPGLGKKILATGVADNTAVTITGRGGAHIWFASDTVLGNFNPKRLADGKKYGEFRADGQYVVVPPSRHIRGSYVWRSPAPQGRAVPPIHRVDAPMAYLRSLLDAAGEVMAEPEFRVQPDFSDEPPLLPTGLPPRLMSHNRLSYVRDILRGQLNGRNFSDRSGQLYWIAKTVASAAFEMRVEINVSQLASIVKLADQKCFECYTTRPDADRQYMTVAHRALRGKK